MGYTEQSGKICQNIVCSNTPTYMLVCTYTLHIYFFFICHLRSMNWALKKRVLIISPGMNSLIAVKIKKFLAWNYSDPTFLHHCLIQQSQTQNFVINCPSSWDWHFHWRMSHKCDVLFHLIVIHQENWNPFVAMEMKILEGQQVKITLYTTTK